MNIFSACIEFSPVCVCEAHSIAVNTFLTFTGFLLCLCVTVIEFDPVSGGYYPVLYLNNYWNLAQEYMPLNDTTK